MKAHIIENGIVVNTIEVESLDFMPNLIDGSIGGIGWKYENGELIEPEIIIEVPQTITPRQLRLQLLTIGLLDEVEALCNANREMQIWFEYSLDFQRSHEMIEAMAVQLGLTQDDMDTFFIEASKL